MRITRIGTDQLVSDLQPGAARLERGGTSEQQNALRAAPALCCSLVPPRSRACGAAGRFVLDPRIGIRTIRVPFEDQRPV
jgi:hypothetical protein